MLALALLLAVAVWFRGGGVFGDYVGFLTRLFVGDIRQSRCRCCC